MTQPSKVSDKKKKRTLSTEDLLGDPKATKEVLIKALGGIVTIRKIKISDSALIHKQSNDSDNPYLVLAGTIAKGLVDPKLTFEEAKQLDVDVAKELGQVILDYSGMLPENVEEVRNFWKKTRA